jgi:ribosomal protein S18 acetylase RimI-like enzyme
MTDIIIREATISDLNILCHLGRDTFYETFAESNSAENMFTYLEENFNGDKVSAEISNPDSLFFIAWEGTVAVGYLKVNSGKAQTEHHDEDTLEIERIYVKSAYHGKKAGQLLYEKAVEVAAMKKSSILWLGVWEENQRAIRFYEKNGFVAFSKHIFRMGEDEQTDIMMKKTI